MLGGFFFKHFLLATNVIGLGARGTMGKMVTALKNSYERLLFPELNSVRCTLGYGNFSEMWRSDMKAGGGQ